MQKLFLLHGFQELEGENTNEIIMKTVKQEMNIDIQEEDLDRSHHIGNPKVCKRGKPRPIIMKFVRHDVHSTMYKN